MSIALSLVYFLAAGLCEIGGGYLVWLWLREGKTPWLAVLGGVVLVLYGIIPTLQPANFGRVYAAYGGVFIVLSLLWGWKIDGLSPGYARYYWRIDRPARGVCHHVLTALIQHGIRSITPTGALHTIQPWSRQCESTRYVTG